MSRFLGTNTLVVAIVLMSTLPAHAALVFWDNDSTDHDFTNPANWVGNLYPLPEDDAVIQNNSHANISSAAENISRVYVGADQGGVLDPPLAKGTGTLSIQTNGTLTTSSSIYVGDGDANEGTVNVTGGSITSGALCLGYGLNSKGTLNVTGGAYLGNGYLYGGWNEGSAGYLNLSNGSISTPSHVRLGYKLNAVGVFDQTGGTLTLGTSTSSVIYAGMAEGAYGYYRLAAGTSTSGGFGVGGTGAVGVIEQEAGSVMNIGEYGM
ncbi:MAG: hypothetical protein GX621_10080, partial [Pirellulaceae bacterium]|nr:hypothetical protein [Pirellulaceae bacterium]